jgi:hypothetical protein
LREAERRLLADATRAAIARHAAHDPADEAIGARRGYVQDALAGRVADLNGPVVHVEECEIDRHARLHAC